MSTVESPVTQLAEVEVNSASMNDTFVPSALICGSISKAAPARMSSRKDSTNSFWGERRVAGNKAEACPVSTTTCKRSAASYTSEDSMPYSLFPVSGSGGWARNDL